jgi:hypothetical protein
MLGWLPKKLAALPEGIRAPQVREVWSAAPCVSHPADLTWDPDQPLNGARLYDTRAAAARAGDESAGGPFTIVGFAARGLRFEAGGAAVTIDPRSVFGDTSSAESPERRHLLRGLDVVRFDGSFDCAPLSCNGLAAEHPANEWCLFDDEASARAFGVLVSREGLYEPPPFYLIEVWG